MVECDTGIKVKRRYHVRMPVKAKKRLDLSFGHWEGCVWINHQYTHVVNNHCFVSVRVYAMNV